MSLTAFSTVERALRVKRRIFSKEINTILDESKSEAGFNKATFDETKVYFEEHWDEIVILRKIVLNLLTMVMRIKMSK